MSRNMSAGEVTSYRLGVLSRVIAASFGGYLLVVLINYAETMLLPVDRYKALLYSLQTGFVFYTLAIIWVFAARSATRAWLGLAIVAAPLALIDSWFYFQGAMV